MLSLILTWAQTLALPLDVSNSRGSGAGLDMDIFWQIEYMTIFIFIIFLLPAAMFFSESNEDESFWSRLCYTIKHMIFVLIVVGLVLGIMYGVIGYTSIPVETYKCSISDETHSAGQLPESDKCETGSIDLKIQVTFPVYVMGLMSFVGWWLLVMFGGIGISAIPLDLINSYRFRPIKKSAMELQANERSLKARSQDLLERANEIKLSQNSIDAETSWFRKRSLKNKLRRDMNKFQADTLLLELDYAIYMQEKGIAHKNPLWYLLYLILGIFFSIVSAVWLLHILLYMLIKNEDNVPVTPFLNEVLTGLQYPGVTFIGTAVYAFLAIYLMYACIKGNVKFGLRFFFCFQAHPMKKDETPMNSMLFNCILILICSVSVTLFMVKALELYTRLSMINNMFGIQIKYLEFFKYFYTNNVFEIMFLVTSK